MIGLQGVIDIHIHSYPEIGLDTLNAAFDDVWIKEAIDEGIRAVYLKSHYWPTVDKAHTLGRLFPGIDIFGGIVLNNTVGGFNPLAVHVAIRNGAQIVWFPTWSAVNDVKSGGYSRRVSRAYGDVPAPYLSVTDSEGKLYPEVLRILELIAEADITLATGHLSVEESNILIRAAKALGVKRMVFTHALTAMVGATMEEQLEIVKLGAYIEHSFIATMPMHQQLSPAKIADCIRETGAENCIMSTDSVFSWNPTPPQMMRMFITSLQELGIRDCEIDLMTKHNPAHILGLTTHRTIG